VATRDQYGDHQSVEKMKRSIELMDSSSITSTFENR
jgi:hypothetical protein